MYFKYNLTMSKLLNLSDFKKIFVYKFEEGDTLKSVAEKFRTTELRIIAMNALSEPPVSCDILLIERAEGREYIVKPLDTLYSICGGDEEKIFALKNKNKTDDIYVGQKLYI